MQLRDRVSLRLHAGPLAAFPPRFVRASVTWLRAHEELLARHVAGVAIVMHSRPLRLALHAMVWASDPAFPMTAADTRVEADTWLAARLRGSVA